MCCIPELYKINVMCVLTVLLARHSSIFLALLGLPYSLKHNIEVGPINNTTIASTCSNERKSGTSLPSNQKLEMIKIIEKGMSKAEIRSKAKPLVLNR